jgi:lysophospholipase L1-like esterase
MDERRARPPMILIALAATACAGFLLFAVVSLLWPRSDVELLSRKPVAANPTPAGSSDVGQAAAGQTVTTVAPTTSPAAPPPAPTVAALPQAGAAAEVETVARLTAGTIAVSRSGARRDNADERRFKNSVDDAADPKGGRGLVILQLGDSHTSADFLSGELRRRLQARYGNGGAGYIIAGRPHTGVRTSALKVAASPGWTYKAIQKSDNISEFWLSGFNAITAAPGETLTFTSENPVTFDSIEIEALRQPGGGAIDIMMDGKVKSSFDLTANAIEPIVLRLTPDGEPTDQVRQIEIKTQTSGAVSIASVAVFNKRSGVSYNSIGYPGATIDILNKFDHALMADDLRRLNPQIVVLVFGTNEASNTFLDAARYEQKYVKVLDKIKAALPSAAIVIVGPPDGAERPSHCAGKPAAESACRPLTTDPAPTPTSNAGAAAKAPDCDWHTLPKLEMIRDVERKIAEQRGLVYWNWASIMPHQCGANHWVSATPPLMTPDHIHFTVTGYTKTAEQLMNTLVPLIDKLQIKPNAVSNN